jgi:hypothetical protein
MLGAPMINFNSHQWPLLLATFKREENPSAIKKDREGVSLLIVNPAKVSKSL